MATFLLLASSEDTKKKVKWLSIQIFVHPFFCVYNLLFISSCIVLGGYFTCNCVHLIWCRSLRLNSNKFRDSTYLKRGPTTSSVIQVIYQT